MDPNTVLLLVDSVEINHRVQALDILGRYLTAIYSSGLTKNPALDEAFKTPISFAILTRCDDIAPEVRVQGLKVLSGIAEILVKFLHETKDETIFKIEDGVDISNLELEVNGEHRFYWYCMASFEERQKELMAMLHRRIDDDHVPARKSAIIAFEQLILADKNLATKKNLKCLKSASKDPDSFVRKLSVQSLTTIFEENQNDPVIQELWLECVLPLVDDPEDRVQSSAMSLLEDLFLWDISASVELETNIPMALLKKLTSNDFLVYHKFMKKAFSEWKLQNKLYPDFVSQLQNCIGTEWEECMWFYLSLFAKYCPIPEEFTKLCLKHVSKMSKRGICPTFMQHIMKTLLYMLEVLPVDALTDLKCISRDGFASYSVPVELIPMYFDMLVKIHKSKETTSELDEITASVAETSPELYEITASVAQICESDLSHIKKEALSSGFLPEDDALTKRFHTIAEIYLYRAHFITPEMIRLLIFFSGCNKHSVVLSPEVKTHALSALGKICLQHKDLAHELLPVYLEKIISDDDTMRNNACLISIDLCKCYPAFTDKCIPIISLCFKDDLYLIRYQTILQIINLLQSDYLKWKAPIFFGFLFAIVDKKEVIRELGHYAFSHLLPLSERQMLPEYFTHSIFVFNYFSPPNDEKVADNVRKLINFSIPGERRRNKRLAMYRFFLDQMVVDEKKEAIEFVCDALTNVAESVYPLNKFTECLVRDCFAILTFIILPFENTNEELENYAKTIEMRLRGTLRAIKVLGSLTSCVKNSRSSLLRDIILFLKDLLSDFVDEIPKILVQDKILLNQVQLEIRKDAERKRMKIKRKRDLLMGRRNREN